MPDRDAPRALDQRLDEAVVDAGLDEAARTGDAGLPGCGKDAGHDAVDGMVDVDIGEDDMRRLAAQFHLAGHEVGRRVGGDAPAGRGAAGEDDLGDAWMARQRVARRRRRCR